MTENEFAVVMSGDGKRWTNHGQTRLRYIVADAISKYARELQRNGRPDRAGRLRYIERELRHGYIPSKRSKTKAAKLLREVEWRLVDGVSVSGLSS